MKLFVFIIIIADSLFFVHSKSIEAEFDKFDKIYQQQLGTTQGCKMPESSLFRVCSDVLRNDGNAPFILHHNKVTPKVVVLFHGLTDSPFYLRSIAKALHQQGYNVVVGLLPGHGKKQARVDMQDANLSDRWREHVAKVVKFSASIGDNIYLAGFSTGGALVTEYVLQHPKYVKGLMLFSGALALPPSVESIAKIWGAQWLAKVLDGEYQSIGSNPYKYPKMSRFAALELMEVILSVRKLISQGAELNLPVFAAHSVVDKIIPIQSVRNLMDVNLGVNTTFDISKELDVCHADVVINPVQLAEMEKQSAVSKTVKDCKNPSANPIHADMLASLVAFMKRN